MPKNDFEYGLICIYGLLNHVQFVVSKTGLGKTTSGQEIKFLKVGKRAFSFNFSRATVTESGNKMVSFRDKFKSTHPPPKKNFDHGLMCICGLQSHF